MLLSIPELERIEEKLNEILKRLEVKEIDKIPEWVDLKTAAKLKSIPYNTLVNIPKLWPDRTEMKKIAGKRRWHKHIVIDWLMKSDDELGYVPQQKRKAKVSRTKELVEKVVLPPKEIKWYDTPTWIKAIEEIRRMYRT